MKIEIKKGDLALNFVDLTNEVALLENASLTFLIGRSEDCTIQIDDPKISREQGELNFNAGVWKIKNISPSVPMSLNGVVVKESELSPNDVISFSAFNLIFYFRSEANKAPSSVLAKPILGNESSVSKEEDSHLLTETAFEAGKDSEIAKHDTDPGSDEASLAPLDHGAVSGEGELNDHHISEGEEHAASSEAENHDLGQANSEPGNEHQEHPGIDPNNLPAVESDVETEGGTKVFRSFAKFELELFGEFAPYERYPLDLPETYIGRDPKRCQIVLNDDEVSSVHAVVRKDYTTCTVEDLNSSNGTILNGSRVKKGEISNGDEFVIGSTTFTIRVVSDLLRSEDERLMPVETNQEVEVEEIVEVNVDDEEDAASQGISLKSDAEQSSGPEEKSFIKRILKDPAKRKKALIYTVVAGALLMLLTDSPPPEGEKSKDKKTAENEKKEDGANGEKKDERQQIAGDVKKKEKPLSKEVEEHMNQVYELAKELHAVGKYSEAIMELDKIFAVTSNFKEARSLKESSKEGLIKLEELEKKRREDEERRLRQIKVKELVEKAKESTKERNVPVSEALFTQVLSLDPENFDVPQLKIELDAWKKEQDRIALELAQKEADRKRKVSQLQPGKTLFLQKEWFKAIVKLQDFMKIQEMDEDLMKDGQGMLEESKKMLSEITGPLLGKARSMKEGQDLKGAYENYIQVLVYDPISSEALEETVAIRDLLNSRAKKVYREAIISESLSLFSDAKEKFQEVQQISPSDSDYYKKSSDRLRDYLE